MGEIQSHNELNVVIRLLNNAVPQSIEYFMDCAISSNGQDYQEISFIFAERVSLYKMLAVTVIRR